MNDNLWTSPLVEAGRGSPEREGRRGLFERGRIIKKRASRLSTARGVSGVNSLQAKMHKRGFLERKYPEEIS